MLRAATQRLSMHGASQRRQLSDRTNALSHYKRKRLLEKIGFGIHNSRRDARRLRLGALRALASPRTRTTHLTVLHRAYGVHEACLDAQVAALDKAPAAEGELEDFSSLQGVAAQFWKEHGDGLRRAPALAAAIKADRPEIVELGEELDAEEHYWSPGTVQFARRVRAVEALNGDLLLGHILGAHQCKNQIVAARLAIEGDVSTTRGGVVSYPTHCLICAQVPTSATSPSTRRLVSARTNGG